MVKSRNASPTRGHKDATVGRKRGDQEAKDTSTWLTRHEASAMLSLSAQTLASYERRGLLHPQYSYRRDVHKIDRRVVVYDPQELTRLRPYRPYSHAAVAPRDPGEVAARAFEMFRAGQSEEDVVVELRLDPDAVRALHDKRLDMGGASLVISPEAKTALEKVVGPFADVTELVEKLVERLGSRPEVRERFEGGKAPPASIPPGAGESVAEVFNTRHAPVSSLRGSAVEPAVEPSEAGASSHATSARDTSTTGASDNDESAARAAGGEFVAAVPREPESVGDPLSGRRAVDGGAATRGATSGIRVAPSSREQLLDAWLESLTADDVRLQRLGALLKREELELFAELERGIRTEVAATTGSDSRREQLLDTLLASLTEDEAQLDKIGAMLTASELDMLAKLGRGLAEGETSAAMNGDALPE